MYTAVINGTISVSLNYYRKRIIYRITPLTNNYDIDLYRTFSDIEIVRVRYQNFNSLQMKVMTPKSLTNQILVVKVLHSESMYIIMITIIILKFEKLLFIH